MLFNENFISSFISNDLVIFKNNLYVLFFVSESFIISVVKNIKKSFNGSDLESKFIISSVSSKKNL